MIWRGSWGSLAEGTLWTRVHRDAFTSEFVKGGAFWYTWRMDGSGQGIVAREKQGSVCHEDEMEMKILDVFGCAFVAIRAFMKSCDNLYSILNSLESTWQKMRCCAPDSSQASIPAAWLSLPKAACYCSPSTNRQFRIAAHTITPHTCDCNDDPIMI